MSSEVVSKKTVKEELEILRQQYGGVVPPKAVVDFARNPKTALHNEFVWDNSVAAERYRLDQARRILRVYVTYEIPEPEHKSVSLNLVDSNTKVMPRKVRGTVSLPSDRKNGGGYRWVEDVLNDSSLREEMLETAKQELATFRRKYKKLHELSEVHEAIDKVIDV